MDIRRFQVSRQLNGLAAYRYECMRFRILTMTAPRTRSLYHNWTREDLISRLQQLESDPVHSSLKTDHGQASEPFSFSSHPRRKIALKFCYSGSEYNGLAFQKDYTPLPTVEGVLFDALARTRLIDPDEGFEGCEWDRCGRTDRGVSAAGQVISLWVRSAIGTPTSTETVSEQTAPSGAPADVSSIEEPGEATELPLMADMEPPFSSCVQKDRTASTELSYVQVLNRVLPPTIRVICWSPVSDSFSARFSCQFRHYKYFFAASTELDISRMRDGAARLVGTHDFRNFCTLDGSKQIDNYNRLIRRADISPVVDEYENVGAMHVFDLVGNAFLYNQVRSIMSVLFLVGSGLEQPNVVSSLLNVDPHNPLPPYRTGEPTQIVDRKPSYQMADGLPLVLWECGYLAEEVQWRTDEDALPGRTVDKDNGTMTTNLRHQMFSIYNRSRIRSTIDGHFLRAAANHHPVPYSPLPLPMPDINTLPTQHPSKAVLNIPLGGGMYVRTAKYKPLLARERGESAEVVNERWRRGRGKKRWEERLVKPTRADDARSIRVEEPDE